MCNCYNFMTLCLQLPLAKIGSCKLSVAVYYYGSLEVECLTCAGISMDLFLICLSYVYCGNNRVDSCLLYSVLFCRDGEDC